MASRTKKPVRRDAAYVVVPNVRRPLAICPDCWSRPSIEGRRKLQSNTRSTRWNLSVADMKWGKDVVKVTILQYPCSNPRCNTVIVVRSALHEGSTLEPWIKRALLNRTDTERYLAEGTDRSGRWNGVPEEVPTEVRVETRPPWILIHATGLDVPKSWTREGDTIKVREGTAQQEKIWAWFRKEGHPLPSMGPKKKKGRKPARTRA